jgi:HEAT repeat protein
MDEARCAAAGERITPQEPVMPKDHDFKRLVRARMDDTGERYTQARAALASTRGAACPLVSDRTRSILGQLADIGLAESGRRYLERLPEPERRAAAIEGLRHQDWRVRRTSALLLDRVDLTAESIAALTRALDDEHPQVRRKAVHSLSCEQCKPGGCAVDVRPLFERVIADRSRLVRGMVVQVCTLHFFDEQWAVDLVAQVAAADPSAQLRDWAAGTAIRQLRERWDSDDRRRRLPPDLVRKTERHPGQWVIIRDGRITAVGYGSDLEAGASRYWVAPADARRPRIP